MPETGIISREQQGRHVMDLQPRHAAAVRAMSPARNVARTAPLSINSSPSFLRVSTIARELAMTRRLARLYR